MKVQLVKIRNMSDGKTQSNMVRFVYSYRDINSANVKAIYTDVGGLDELQHNFELLKSKVFTEKSNGYTEVTFKTRDGVTGGCYWDKDGWIPYIKFTDNDDSYVQLERGDVDNMISLFHALKEKLAISKIPR